jgi:cysteinyl-tRNA synthetase
MHNNMVTVNGVKMGKSLKNSVNLKDLFKETDPLVIRFFILQSHYRSQLDYSQSAIKASTTGLEKLRETRRRLHEQKSGTAAFEVEPFLQRFTDAMDDDFNTPVAIAVLFDLSKAINASLDDSEGIAKESRELIEAFLHTAGSEILGILNPNENTLGRDSLQTGKKLEGIMEILLEMRADARSNKNFALSDKIRDRLLAVGIEIKDTKEGVSWSQKSGT